MINKWCKRISNHICTNQNEREIIQYGLNQFFWILLIFFAIAISGVFWHEFCFSILVFLEIYFLRPYAGGYHADTEIKCCMISRSEEHTSELQSRFDLVCRLLLEKKKTINE